MADKILVAEDDRDICEIIEIYLTGEGYEVTIVHDGLSVLKKFQEETFSLIILDIMMPGMDGYKVTREIRKSSYIPIIIISAKNEDNDKILGLNIGADDYIAKPFNPLEVVARVNAHLRRNKTYNEVSMMKNTTFKLRGLTLKSDTCRFFKKDKEILLTATEYKIMNLFMKHPGQVFSKVQIAQHISGEYYETDDHTIVVHISNLREKLGKDDKGLDYIKTMKGLGYKIEKN